MDLTQLFSIFLVWQTGAILLIVMGVVHYLKSIVYKYMNGTRQHPVFKSTLPILVCVLSTALALVVSPEPVSDDLGQSLTWGFAVGVIINWLYQVGPSAFIRHLGLEEMTGRSLPPPSNGTKSDGA